MVEIHVYSSEKQEEPTAHFQKHFTCQATNCKACPYWFYWKIQETV